LKFLVGIQMHCLASVVHLFELVYECFRRLEKMEWGLQSHKAGYATDEKSAADRLHMPYRQRSLKMPDIAEDLFGVGLTQVNSIARRQILLVKITIARPRVSRHKYQMSQYVRQHVAPRMQTGNLDLLFRCLAEPDKCMSVRCCRARTKIHVVSPFGRDPPDRL